MPISHIVMHELSIAMNIIEIAEEQCMANNGKAVGSVQLEIGCLSGVVKEALEFALESARSGTMLDKAEFRIDMIEGVARCQECSHEFSTGDYINMCPACGSFRTEILKGREMRVKSMQII